MKESILKILLLFALVTFFVVRPFIVSNSFGFSSLVCTVQPGAHQPAAAINKRDDIAVYHVSHVSACDDTSFRKVALNAIYKLAGTAWKQVLLFIAALITTGLYFRLRGRRKLAEIISAYQYFHRLCLLRI